MNRLRKFLRLSTVEKWLLIKVTLLLWGIKLGLKLLPFQTVRRFLDKLAKVPVGLHADDLATPERIVWAIELADRSMPGTCLTRALAARVLLVRRGYPAQVHIGVIGGKGREFLAHAWVESRGKVVIGNYELESYTPLTVLGENP
jgi:hypothetical protein